MDIYGDPDGKLGALQVAIGDGVAAVTWTEDDYAQGTFAVSLDDEPRMLWQRAGFWKLGGSSDALVGFRDDPDQEYPLTGVAPADGRDLWSKKMPQGTLSSIGGSPFAKFEEDGSEQAQLIDVATGDFVLSERAGLTSRMDCSQGEGGTVVLCASKQDGALAVDKDGKILWRRAGGNGAKDWNATAEADFKDLFYAKGRDGTFVVDGRTGRTVSADAGIVPEHVNAYAALVYTDAGAEVHHAKR